MTARTLEDGTHVLLMTCGDQTLPAEIITFCADPCPDCGGQMYACRTEAGQEFNVCRAMIALKN
jgi:hypothetical protein